MQPPFFSSLRWRLTAWYGGALIVLLLLFAIVMYAGLRRALLASIAQRVDGVTAQLDAYSSGNAASPFGPVSVMTRLSEQEALDRFAGPGLFIEVYNARGFVVAKSSNLGSADIPHSGYRLEPPTPALNVHDGGWGETAAGAQPLLAHWHILRENKRPLATIYVAESLETMRQTLGAFRGFLSLCLGLAVAIIAIAMAWLARTTIGPINEIARAAGEIGSDDLAKRLGWHGRRDELGMLAATFDDMLSRLQATFARERRFIADASHELKTPLTVINANAQMLERWADHDEALRKEALKTIRSESAAMAHVISAMLTLARADRGDALSTELVDLSAVTKDVASSLRPSAQAKGLILKAESDDEAFVHGEQGLLRQLILNLTENAIKFTDAGTVALSVRCNGSKVRLEVHDTGRGIPESALSQIFDRFYRADPARSRFVDGTGLGLAVVHSIVHAHGASIEARSDGKQGTTFVVDFPKSSST